MTLTVRLTEAADEIDAAHDLRRRVFLGEQEVDAKDEFDEFEATRPRWWPWTRAASSRPAACASTAKAGET